MYLQAMRMLYIYFESLTAHSKFYFCKFTIYFIIHRINTTATLHGAVTNFICSSDSSLENLPSFQLLFSNGRGRAALSLFPRRERMTSQVQTQFICLTSHEGFGIVSVPSACVFQSPWSWPSHVLHHATFCMWCKSRLVLFGWRIFEVF